MDMDTTRFQSAEWFSELKRSITIGGAGSIGSWLTLLLMRTEPEEVYVYDFDVVESSNYAGQFYGIHNLGQSKVIALNDNIYKYTGQNFNANRRYELTGSCADRTFDICFSCFDNMKVRKEMFYQWLNKKPHPCLSERPYRIFIDCRLGFEYFQIFCVRPLKGDVEAYLDTLFNDNEVPDMPCSLKVNTFIPAMAASQMMAFYLNFLTNIKLNKNVRKVPFSYEFHTDSLVTLTTPSIAKNVLEEVIGWVKGQPMEYVTEYVRKRLFETVSDVQVNPFEQPTVQAEIVEDEKEEWQDNEDIECELVEDEEEQFVLVEVKPTHEIIGTIDGINIKGKIMPTEDRHAIMDEITEHLAHVERPLLLSRITNKLGLIQTSHAEVIYQHLVKANYAEIHNEYGMGCDVHKILKKEAALAKEIERGLPLYTEDISIPNLRVEEGLNSVMNCEQFQNIAVGQGLSMDVEEREVVELSIQNTNSFAQAAGQISETLGISMNEAADMVRAVQDVNPNINVSTTTYTNPIEQELTNIVREEQNTPQNNEESW
jgi:molybdopterin/thiamine biosynthesis adenylyltransferase